MFQFATEALELYHQRKLLSVAHNRVDHYISVKYRGLNASKIPKEHIEQLPNDADQFLVKLKVFTNKCKQHHLYCINIQIQ